MTQFCLFDTNEIYTLHQHTIILINSTDFMTVKCDMVVCALEHCYNDVLENY